MTRRPARRGKANKAAQSQHGSSNHCCHGSGSGHDHHGGVGKPWYKQRFYQVTSLVIIIVALGFFVEGLSGVTEAFLDYLWQIWWAIPLGLLLGGVIDYLVPDDHVTALLARKRKRTLLNAVGFGFLMSVCSHGILAIAIELYKKGASVPAVIAFLMAAPWANMTITIMLFGFFGLKALAIIFAAIVIALITGYAYQVLDRLGWIEASRPVTISANYSIRADIKRRWRESRLSATWTKKAAIGIGKGTWSLTKMVLWWVLLGMLLAAFARAYVPSELFQQYLGPTLLGLVLTLIFATIIEVCSEGSSPIAFEIFRQTGALGNPFVFLMAGVATDYTEIGLLWTNIGKKAALWLPVVTVPQIVLVAWLFNLFL